MWSIVPGRLPDRAEAELLDLVDDAVDGGLLRPAPYDVDVDRGGVAALVVVARVGVDAGPRVVAEVGVLGDREAVLGEQLAELDEVVGRRVRRRTAAGSEMSSPSSFQSLSEIFLIAAA